MYSANNVLFDVCLLLSVYRYAIKSSNLMVNKHFITLIDEIRKTNSEQGAVVVSSVITLKSEVEVP